MKKILKNITPRFVKRWIIRHKIDNCLDEIHYEFGFSPDVLNFDEQEIIDFEIATNKLARLSTILFNYS